MRSYLSLLLIICFTYFTEANNSSFDLKTGKFLIANQKETTSILVDTKDAAVVTVAADLFASDVKKIVGSSPKIVNTVITSNRLIILGTLQSKFIKQLLKDGKINAAYLEGKWEASHTFLVKNPFLNVKEALVIVGSDRRGAAYGILKISKDMGVSPWEWWADVTPKQQKSIYYTSKESFIASPSIKYRGIFINDEDWSLRPWIKKTFDKEVKNFGPKTYQKVFELMLRLRINYLWPAMHRASKAFNAFPENAILADKYAIIGGSSHAEPMLRNNYVEWEHGVEKWNYFTHKELVNEFWDSCVEERGKYENVYTIGMRGIHDDQMAGSGDFKKLANQLESIFEDQRHILEKHTGKNATEVPQVFIPYKEVQYIYDQGLKVPDDVTICWTEDNQGYLRKVPTKEELKRSGGHGLYYHLSYWSDYLWLSSIQPQLIAYEMEKAYQNGINKLWVLNVGDIKACEKELEFFMDLAWDVKKWNPENADKWVVNWANNTFGNDYGEEIANVLNVYYRLSFRGKPEHLGHINYPLNELYKRLEDYNNIAQKALALKEKIPKSLQTAFIHLVYYQVMASKYHADKILKARLSFIEASKGHVEKALSLGEEAKIAYKEVLRLDDLYNNASDGKWKNFMTYHVRRIQVLREPLVFTEKMIGKHDGLPTYMFEPKDAKLHGAMEIVDNKLTVKGTDAKLLENSYASYEFPVNRAVWKLNVLYKTPKPKDDVFKFEIDRHYEFKTDQSLWGKNWSWKEVGEMRMDPASYKLKINANELNAEVKQIFYTADDIPFYPILQEPNNVFTLSNAYKKYSGVNNTKIKIVKGLSFYGEAAYMYPHNIESIETPTEAPGIEFKVNIKKGENWLRPMFLPSHAVSESGKLRCAITINDKETTVFDLHQEGTNHNIRGCDTTLRLEDEPCLRGYVFDDLIINSDEDKEVEVKLSFLDPGLVFYALEVYHNQ